MLQYIYNADVGILKHYGDVDVETDDCLLKVCHTIRNRDCFMYIFKYLVTNEIIYNTDWHEFTPYLLEAVQLYPPHGNLARWMLNNFINGIWSNEREQVVKLLIPLSNGIHKDILTTQYSHLVPHLEPTCTFTLYDACADNNIEEVKHRLQYSIPDGRSCYNVISSHIDNRECLKLMLLHLNDRSCGNTFLITAYVNNKLPDYTIEKYNNDVTMKAVICHFTGCTNLDGATWNDSLLDIAYKFRFNTSLLYECVKIAIANNYNMSLVSHSMKHQVDAIVNKINNTPSSPCLCDLCRELELY